MTDMQNTSQGFNPESVPGDPLEEMHLDDARRIKVMSPGMLVFKRFIRNKLAVIGLVIIVSMFLFAFLGPFLSPYSQTQVFKGVGSMVKDFAGATYNTELRYTVADASTVARGAALDRRLLRVCYARR